MYNKCQHLKFSDLSLPGVEIVPTPCGSILPIWTPSQLPYNEKSENCSNKNNFYIKSPRLYSSLKGWLFIIGGPGTKWDLGQTLAQGGPGLKWAQAALAGTQVQFCYPPHLWCGIAIMSGVVVLGRSGIRDFLPQINDHTKHALCGCSPRTDVL